MESTILLNIFFVRMNSVSKQSFILFKIEIEVLISPSGHFSSIAINVI